MSKKQFYLFYEKLLFLKDLMHTETTKKIEKERYVFIQQLFQEFYNKL